MQSQIREHPDFESKIKNDPIALLDAIKILIHDHVRAQYPMVSMTEALTWLVNAKQMENEPLLDYVKHFKQLHNVVKSHLGTKILDIFTEQSKEYQKLKDAKKETEMKEAAFNAWIAYLFMRGSDQSKYGSIIKGFNSQFSLGNDQYLKTIQMAMDVLSNHKLDTKFFENKQRKSNQLVARQDEEVPPAASFSQKKDVVCYVCSKPGHTKPECPDADKIPWSKWAINKAMGAMQHTKVNNNDAKDDLDNDLVKLEASTYFWLGIAEIHGQAVEVHVDVYGKWILVHT